MIYPKSIATLIEQFQKFPSVGPKSAQRMAFQVLKMPYSEVEKFANAILNATSSLKGCTLYVTLFPCCECAKLVIQSGIKEIVYISDKHAGDDSTIASKRLFDAAGVKTRQFKEMDVIIKC